MESGKSFKKSHFRFDSFCFSSMQPHRGTTKRSTAI